ncbi:hypothetical protein ACO11K_002849 [Bacillus cytotoxicus]
MEELTWEEIYKVLMKSWSLETRSKWSERNLAKGQYGVTALVVNDFFDGEIKKTRFGEDWHFYNVIDGRRYDFTAAQFKEEIIYEDTISSREEAFADTNRTQYNALKQNVCREYKKLLTL